MHSDLVMENSDEPFMLLAVEQARLAAQLGEVPVGAVVCHGSKVVGRGYNRRESGKNALLHAEIIAIYQACENMGGWRLHECDLYVTLEPCPMCAGAIINSRIRRVVYGADDPKAGCFGSILNFSEYPFNHHPKITSHICMEECRDLLTSFFRQLRKKLY